MRNRVNVVKIAFLDDDPVIRIARLVLSDRQDDPWIRDFFAPERPDLTALLQAARGLRCSDGVEIVLAESGNPQTEVRGANVIIFRRGTVTSSLLDANPGLRLVQRFGERPDGIDLTATAARGIPVSCVPRRTLNYTAEHALLLMLALAKKLLPSDRAVRTGGYDPSDISSLDNVAYNWAGFSDAGGLAGRTLGIVGLGEVGTLVTRLARAFGMRVIYNKRRRATAGEEEALGASYADLPALLATADFVSLHAANLPENDRLADRAFFERMKASAFFINTSRGRLVDEDALFEALAAGRIAGAGLDVHRVEPRAPRDRFASWDNVVLTPHLAGGARSGVLDELAVIIHNCHAVLGGGSARFVVEVQAGAEG